MRVSCLLCVLLLTGFSFTPRLPKNLALTNKDHLRLAQVAVGEADWSKSDHIAIAWVLAKRWKLFQRNPNYDPARHTFSGFIMRYSSTMKSNKTRAKRIRQLPWGDPLETHSANVRLESYAQRWAKVRHTITEWREGRHPDPCPRALHWGGSMDDPEEIKRPGVVWRPVSCGATRNTFYRPLPIPDDA